MSSDDCILVFYPYADGDAETLTEEFDTDWCEEALSVVDATGEMVRFEVSDGPVLGPPELRRRVEHYLANQDETLTTSQIHIDADEYALEGGLTENGVERKPTRAQRNRRQAATSGII